MAFLNIVIVCFAVAARELVDASGKVSFLNVVIGMFVVLLVIIHRELLIHRTSFGVIALISVILFLLGFINILFYMNGYETSISSSLLLCPLITLGYFRLCRKIFLKMFSREPQDTFLIWNTKGLEKNILFNLIYLIPSICLLMLGSVTDRWLVAFTGK